ncbi:MAG TPA: hypothetical protein VKQ72_19130 [Aggregatilineales bacterium]|nr:hypothetical protein [Aggregatilineales bacterium]
MAVGRTRLAEKDHHPARLRKLAQIPATSAAVKLQDVHNFRGGGVRSRVALAANIPSPNALRQLTIRLALTRIGEYLYSDTLT